MSKQLSLSIAFSVLAMAAFVLQTTPDHMPTGAPTHADAPAAVLLSLGQIVADRSLLAE